MELHLIFNASVPNTLYPAMSLKILPANHWTMPHIDFVQSRKVKMTCAAQLWKSCIRCQHKSEVA